MFAVLGATSISHQLNAVANLLQFMPVNISAVVAYNRREAELQPHCCVCSLFAEVVSHSDSFLLCSQFRLYMCISLDYIWFLFMFMCIVIIPIFHWTDCIQCIPVNFFCWMSSFFVSVALNNLLFTNLSFARL